MNIIFLGAPGAGKGTQASHLSRYFHLPTISTGDMLRKSVKEQTPVGKEAARYMEEGKLVPDSTIITMLKERIAQPDCLHGFILDGFPRTLAQAHELDNLMKQEDKNVDLVLYLSVDEGALVDRIVGRFTCKNCGKTYHEKLFPPKQEGVCDVCGHKEFSRRQDDNAETVRARLKEYHKLTMPILPFYKEKGCLHEIDGMRSPSEVTHQINGLVERFSAAG